MRPSMIYHSTSSRSCVRVRLALAKRGRFFEASSKFGKYFVNHGVLYVIRHCAGAGCSKAGYVNPGLT